MADANYFIVTIRRAVDRTDIDPTITMAAHTLALTPEGHLSIEAEYQSRTFSAGAWEGFEVKRIVAKRG